MNPPDDRLVRLQSRHKRLEIERTDLLIGRDRVRQAWIHLAAWGTFSAVAIIAIAAVGRFLGAQTQLGWLFLVVSGVVCVFTTLWFLVRALTDTVKLGALEAKYAASRKFLQVDRDALGEDLEVRGALSEPGEEADQKGAISQMF